MQKLETIIGLEIHLQLKTKSKMFCACANDGENQAANTTICPICLGHPGTLPAINQAAVKFGLNFPLAFNGFVIISHEGKQKRIGIERLHLEEDAAKNIHQDGQTLVDFNRAGTPLAEIVSKPDFRDPAEAKIFLQALRLLARYLGVSEAEMEKGHLRCDANISLRRIGDTKLYPKTEVKNLNSFRSVERALVYEVKRQTELWQQNAAPNFTSTRGWDENKQITIEQRRKEGSSDYRYFPEPDLPPLVISDELLAESQNSLPELPQAKLARLMSEFALNFNEAEVLVKNKDWADYFESVISELAIWFEQKVKNNPEKAWENNKAKLAKLTCGWLTSEVFKLLPNDFKFSDLKITPENMAEFLSLIYDHTINSSAGQTMLAQMFKTGDDPSHLLEK